MKKQGGKQQLKNYDSYRYQSQTVTYYWGEKVEYYKEAHTKRMDVLSEEASKISADICGEFDIVKTKYKPDEYDKQWQSIFNKYAPMIDVNHAEYVAEYLVANNIAQRGKPLHCSTAIKKMNKKYKKDPRCIGMFFFKRDVVNCQINDLSFKETNEQNLAYFLHNKYDILLLNGNTYDYCQKKIAEYNLYGNFYKKELQHYQNLLKKFYVADIKQAYC